jgi:hypothetical protein
MHGVNYSEKNNRRIHLRLGISPQSMCMSPEFNQHWSGGNNHVNRQCSKEMEAMCETQLASGHLR